MIHSGRVPYEAPSFLRHYDHRYQGPGKCVQAIPNTTHLIDLQFAKTAKILQTPSGQCSTVPPNPITLLLGRLSFSHFVELVKIESSLKRTFYETESIRNNWSVRELQRAINSMLFERTGLSIPYANTAINPLITAPSLTASKTLDSELPC
jgi:hypothetical protein